MIDLPAASTLSDNWPFAVLGASILFIIVAITKLKLHPFIALVLAALFAGVLARFHPESTVVNGVTVIGSLTDVLKLTMDGFGRTAAGVAVSIGLASIIG